MVQHLLAVRREGRCVAVGGCSAGRVCSGVQRGDVPERPPFDARLVEAIGVVARFPAGLDVPARWLVLDKPSGVLSVPGRRPEHQASAANWVREKFAEASGPITVHRLDMDTSGLLVVALDAEMQRALSVAFEQRAVHKGYTAIVDGHVDTERGMIDLPMRLDVDRRPMQIIDHELGRPAQTQFEVVMRGEWVDAEQGGSRRASLLRLTPMTGRTHQLRVHCAAIGHPILGDLLYASAEARDASGRLLLHAESLGLHDPINGEAVTVKCPAPFGLDS